MSYKIIKVTVYTRFKTTEACYVFYTHIQSHSFT